MTGFIEEARDVHWAIKALSPEAKRERRRAQWRAYSASEKGRVRQARYNDSFKGLMRGLDYQIRRQQKKRDELIQLMQRTKEITA